MQRTLRLAVIACAALLAVPAGAATWYGYGSYEPDTTWDTPSFMFKDAPTPATSGRLYFNVYTSTGGPFTSSTGVNPNLGAAQSNIELAAQESHFAVLGVWMDCNNDGYIGLAETAMREYPSEVLGVTGGSCPAVSFTGNCWAGAVSPCPAWPARGYHNVNGWVTELIPIGSVETTAGDRRLIKDASAMIWGDYGKPTDSAEESGGGTCAITPPRGTTQSSGGALEYLDCNFLVIDILDLPWDTLGQDPLGLTFQDDDDGQSGALGGVETLGDDHSDNAIVRTGDCNSEPVVPADTFPAPVSDNVGDGIRAPDAGYVNPDGNVAGTVNHTRESAPLAEVPNGDIGPDSTSNCDFEDDRGEDVYNLVEEDFQGVSATNKIEADWNFAFQTNTRGGAPLGVVRAGPSGAPADAGIEAINALGLATQRSGWVTGEGLTKGLFSTVAVRNDLDPDAPSADQVGADIGPGYWLSFYAHVGAATRDAGVVLPGGSAKYGAPQCGLQTSGVHNGWNCDGTQWYINPDGSPQPEPAPLARPGQTYVLRDVDCHDGGLNAVGVGIQPAFYGPENCRAG